MVVIVPTVDEQRRTTSAARFGANVGGDDEGEGGAAPAAGFTDEELQWGRKEAKSRLGAEAFKEWRKAARKAGK